LPTGSHEALWQVGAQRAPLPHDLQLGFGRPTLSLMLDQVIDHTWGPAVFGATANHRGGRTAWAMRAPRRAAPCLCLLSLGAFVPVLGAFLNAALGPDLNLG
jgi:hypothetical protein